MATLRVWKTGALACTNSGPLAWKRGGCLAGSWLRLVGGVSPGGTGAALCRDCFPSVSSDAHASDNSQMRLPEVYRCCGSFRNLRSWYSFCRSVVSPARSQKPLRSWKVAKTQKFQKVRGLWKAATFQEVRKSLKVAVSQKARWRLLKTSDC